MRPIKPAAKGLGLRNEHVDELCQRLPITTVDFLELAPENWMNMGGYKRACLDNLAAKYPLVAHGLSLSIGDTQPLNIPFIERIRDFLDDYQIVFYSEHFSFSRDKQGYLYDLLPLPRHADNLPYFVDRIKQVQDILHRPLILENISYYHCYADEMPEAEFLSLLIEKSECQLLLDINNVYVNSHNHHYDPVELIEALPSQAITYYHIAGHYKNNDDFILDTHGMPVDPAVIALAQKTVQYHGIRPLLLERDHHLPLLDALCDELAYLANAMENV